MTRNPKTCWQESQRQLKSLVEVVRERVGVTYAFNISRLFALAPWLPNRNTSRNLCCDTDIFLQGPPAILSPNVNDELIFRRTYPESTLSVTVAIQATTNPRAPFLARMEFQQHIRRRSRCTSFVQIDKIRWTLISTEYVNAGTRSNKRAIAKGIIQPQSQDFAASMSSQPHQMSSSFLMDMPEIVRGHPKKRFSYLGMRSTEAVRCLPNHLCLIIDLETREEQYDNEDLVLVSVKKHARHSAFYDLTVAPSSVPASGCYRFSSPEAESLPTYVSASNDGPPLYPLSD